MNGCLLPPGTEVRKQWWILHECPYSGICGFLLCRFGSDLRSDGRTPVEGPVARCRCSQAVCDGNENSVLAFDRDLDLLFSEAGYAFSGCHDGRLYCSFLWSCLHAGSGRGVILGSGRPRRRIWNDHELVEYGGIKNPT